VKPLRAAKVKNGEAVRRALEYILANQPQAFLLGLDVATYGSAFKTCKGLVDRFGPGRVIDMPICEAGTVGFALGASQVGGEPIIEFQFADFSTEACTQIGFNAGTWYYRAGREAPLLLRLPCGGGLTLGAFHSSEMEGLWSHFPGLKVLYPATAQETYESILAGFYDRNPCLVLENKLLYWSHADDIDFDGDLRNVWRPRRYTEGSEVTVIALGAMVHEALAAAGRRPGLEVWNPLVLEPLELGPILDSLAKTRRLLVVQECGASQGLGDRLISLAVRQLCSSLQCPPKLLAAPDVPVPFAPELEAHYRPNAEKILAVVAQMLREA
jgi:2-oxoisovalerate dehydrogenase E1 component